MGYKHIWLDDGWAVARDNTTGRVIEDPVLFPSGMGNLSAFCHELGLKFGIYTSKGPLTCLGYAAGQPKRPGSCGFEENDANTYAEWKVDQVKDDGCGQCPQHDPWVAMGDALNKTGRRIWYAIHAGTDASPEYPRVANMWRCGRADPNLRGPSQDTDPESRLRSVGGDLYASSFDMWTNRLDLATTAAQVLQRLAWRYIYYYFCLLPQVALAPLEYNYAARQCRKTQIVRGGDCTHSLCPNGVAV